MRWHQWLTLSPSNRSSRGFFDRSLIHLSKRSSRSFIPSLVITVVDLRRGSAVVAFIAAGFSFSIISVVKVSFTIAKRPNLCYSWALCWHLTRDSSLDEGTSLSHCSQISIQVWEQEYPISEHDHILCLDESDRSNRLRVEQERNSPFGSLQIRCVHWSLIKLGEYVAPE